MPIRMPRRAALAQVLLAGVLLAAPVAVRAADASVPAAAGHDHAAVPHDAASSQPKEGRSAGRKDAWLYIGWPNNGDTVSTHFKVWFGLRNFGVAPAGTDRENTGHHHLLIDTVLTNPDEPIPADKQHLHFGNGQTETYLDLPPGRHTLQLVLADGNHVPHDPPIVSKKITITVVQSRRTPQVSSQLSAQ